MRRKFELRFKTLAIDGRESISADLPANEVRGIYAYEFTDGMWYVGKSIDVRKRHADHMREYKKLDPPRVAKIMEWAPLDCTDEELDYAETATIADFEAKGRRLTNLLKTGRPAGELARIVDTGLGWGVPIPWERENLPASSREFEFEPDEGKRKRFEKLVQDDCYEQLIAILTRYVGSTIPAPADTAGTLWTATALPTTHNGGRLCTISCQNAETLVVFRGDTEYPEPWGFVNVKKPEGVRLPLWRKRGKPDYGTLPNAVRFEFHTLAEAERLLSKERALDACYRANAELMRRGASMYRRYNNPYLVKAILGSV